MPATRTVISAVLSVLFLGGSVGLFHTHLHAQQELPPISWVCPMPEDAEVNEAEPGMCPICGMELVPVRLDLAYSCPNHPAVIRDEPGLCPLDKRELVQVTVGIHWNCPSNPYRHLTEPGTCEDGSPRQMVRELRAHGDHNPRYGGLFYMAADNWHHLEGAYPSQGLFRVYLYDNFTQPIEARGFSGRVLVLNDRNEEVSSAPLVLSQDGQSLEARVNAGPPPVRLAAMVRLKPDTPEQRFDFPMQAYSVAPATPPPAPARTITASPPAAPAARPAAPAATPSPAAAAPAATPSPAPAAAAAPPAATPPVSTATAAAGAPPVAPPPSTVEFAPTPTRSLQRLTSCEPNMSRTDVLLASDLLPADTRELLSLLHMCGEEVRKLIDAGQFGYVYQPTMLGKDIGLALENHLTDLNAQQRRAAADAIRRLVVVAWRLDMYGDLGNMLRLKDAMGDFTTAIEDLESAYGTQQ